MATASALFSVMMFATLLFLVAIVIFFAQRYKRCPPDKVMVVYGRTDKGKASRTIRWCSPCLAVNSGLCIPFTYTDYNQHRS